MIFVVGYVRGKKYFWASSKYPIISSLFGC
jgi:hypothetical protein